MSPTYELIDLGVANSDSTFVGAGPSINDAGTVVYGDPIGLAIWTSDGLTYLPDSGNGSIGLDINNRGDIVGLTGQGDPFAWIDGAYVDLDAIIPGPGRALRVTAINNKRMYLVQTNENQSYVVQADFAMQLGGDEDRVSASDLNEIGFVVGSLRSTDGDRVPFLWDGHHAAPLAEWEGGAYGINDGGEICGNRVVGVPETQPFVFDSGEFTFADLIPGSTWNIPLSINDDGVVVGLVNITGGGLHAAVWIGGRWSLLQDMVINADGWVIEQASDINEHGQIVGIAVASGVFHAVLLEPLEASQLITPESATRVSPP